MATNFVMTATQQVDLTVGNLRDKRGNAVPTDGPTTVTSLEPETVSVEAHPDGAADHYLIKAVGPTDTAAIVEVSADAKPGAEVEIFNEHIMFEIMAGAPVSFGLTLGAAEEQPEAPEPVARKKKSKR
jgi:hypothetical protein